MVISIEVYLIEASKFGVSNVSKRKGCFLQHPFLFEFKIELIS